MLGRFERLMEQTVEGGMRRLFRTPLQPVQLAKAAARAMEEAQVVGIHGPDVPNYYRVRLAPADFDRFAPFGGTLTADLEAYLAEYARDRGLRPVAEPRVELHADSTVRAGNLRVETRFVGLEPARRAALEEALEDTRALRLGPLGPGGRAAGAMPAAPRWLVAPDGTRYALDPEDVVVRIGRSLDNDVTLESARVSRYHAQLRWEGGRWLIYDLQSTNGTAVDGRRVGADPLPLPADGYLRLGDVDLLLRPA